MAMTAIKKMKVEQEKGIIDQNGFNVFKYGAYDDKGRIVGGKEGIVTNPVELTPRQRLVKKDISVFNPVIDEPSRLPKSTLVDGKVEAVAPPPPPVEEEPEEDDEV